jgi:hypothetical protein
MTFSIGHQTLIASSDIEQYFIFQKDNKKGIRNANDEIIIPAQYEDLGWSIGEFQPLGELLGYKENGLWGVMTLENERVSPPIYQTLYPLNQQLMAASKIDDMEGTPRYGIINLHGDTVLNFEMGWLSMFNNKIIASRKKGQVWKYGMLNLSFQEVIPFKYSSIKPVNNQFAVIIEAGKSGLISTSGEVVVAPKYHQIELQGRKFRGKLFDTYEIRNQQNQLLASEQLESMESVTQGVIMAKGNNSTRLMGADGRTITEQANIEFLKFTSKWALFKRNGSFGIMDLSGNELLKPEYKKIWITEGYAGVQSRSGEWKLINDKLQVITERDYQQINPINEGLFPVVRQQSWGFIDGSGEEIIPPQYQEVSAFNEGQAYAKYLGSWGVIDLNGNWLVKPRYDQLKKINSHIYLFEQADNRGIVNTKQHELYKTTNQLIGNATGVIEIGQDGKSGLVSFDGEPLLSVQYATIRPFREDPRYYRFQDDVGLGIFNIEQQKFFRDTTIQEMRTLDEGYIGIRINDQYGLIDLNGKLRIANRYEDVGVFKEDMLPVKIRGRWGYVDRLERLKIQPVYQTADPFDNGLAVVSKNSKFGLVRKNGEVVLSLEYDKIERLEDGNYLFYQRGEVGLVSTEGRVLIYPRYDSLEILASGHLKISKNGKLGVVTKQGKTLIPPVHDQVNYDQYNQVYLLTKRYTWDEIKL